MLVQAKKPLPAEGAVTDDWRAGGLGHWLVL